MMHSSLSLCTNFDWNSNFEGIEVFVSQSHHEVAEKVNDLEVLIRNQEKVSWHR